MGINNGKDYNRTTLKDMLIGLYYYYLDGELLRENSANGSVFGYAPTIQNISFNPFLNQEIVTATRVPLDNSFFGVPSANQQPNVFRISHIDDKEVKLGEIDLYTDIDKENTESRLFLYPYRYFLICDYLNPPLLIQPQLVSNGASEKIEFYVKCSLSQTSKYNIFAKNYKGDDIGNIEGLVNNNPLLFPVGSSAYAQFLATSGNSFNQANSNALMENDISLKQGTQMLDFERKQNLTKTSLGMGASVLGGIGSLSFGGLASGLTSAFMQGVDGHFNNQRNGLNQNFLDENSNMKEFQIESMALAKKNDLLNTPRTMKSLGNDSIFNLSNAKRKVEVLEYRIQPHRYFMIEQYFKRYGYKVDRYGQPNLKSRKYYNFIKFHKCNIDSAEIPHEEIKQLESIFESGVTFWHVENGAKIKDYSIDNKEV